MSHASTHPVLLLVSRRAKLGHEAEFERRMEAFIRTAETYPGCLGAQLVHPGEEEEVEDTLYHALMAFQDVDSRNTWQESPERAGGLASIKPYIEGQAVERGISGLAHWFQPHSGAKLGQPPRWKVAVVTWLGIFPTVYLLFRLLGDALAGWSLLPRLLLLTLLVVAIMTWLVAPQLTRLLKPWLFPAPKTSARKTPDGS